MTPRNQGQDRVGNRPLEFKMNLSALFWPSKNFSVNVNTMYASPLFSAVGLICCLVCTMNLEYM